jgi:hypothetical protein
VQNDLVDLAHALEPQGRAVIACGKAGKLDLDILAGQIRHRLRDLDDDLDDLAA